ncbi:MAG: MFS transporter [Methanobacterium sp.]|nr:MFS transporter [Methanobacterium sp.]
MMLNQYKKLTNEHYKILGLSWAGWVFDFYDLILFTFLIIPIGLELHLSNVMLSYAIGVSLAATAVGGVIFGVLSDRYGRKTALQWTIILYSAGTLLCGFATSLETLILFRIITGLGVGGEWATGQTYIGETFPAKLRGRYGSFMQTGAPIGIILASVVGGFLAPTIGWRESFIISVLPAIMVIFIRKKLPESDVWLKRSKSNIKHEFSSFSSLKTVISKSKFMLLFSKEYRKTFLLALILAVFGMSAYWFTYSWMPDYLHNEKHFSLVKSALWVIVTQVGGFIGYLSFGFVADWIGRRPAYMIYSSLMALGLVMITVLWDSVVIYPAVILSFMFLVGFGTGIFGGYGPLFSELFPTKIRNTATGAAFNLARGVQFFTPIIIALIATKYSLGVGIFLAAIFALLTGIWVWTLPETKGRQLEDLEKPIK